MIFKRLLSTNRSVYKMELKNVIKVLNCFAPSGLAEKWDNVGLLIEPSAPLQVKKILLTNDLTPPVLDEAVSMGTNLIISYHPPIFSGMKRLTQNTWKERIVTRCLENRIAVYSPHTSYDCVQDGVNDWLIQAFDVTDVKPIQQRTELLDSLSNSISASVPASQYNHVVEAIAQIPHKELSPLSCVSNSTDKSLLTIACPQSNVGELVRIISRFTDEFIEVKQMSKVPRDGYGMGRIGKLKSSITIEEAVEKVKSHLNLKSIRLAKSPDCTSIDTVAVCAGSGGSLLKDVKSSLYLTGEMSHHDILHAVYNGTNVILCDHSNTERGFLTVLKSRLSSMLDGMDIVVSNIDRDPLDIV